MNELVIASNNTYKVLQIREMLKELAPKACVLSLFDFPSYKLPPHDASKSLQENARLKAEHAANELKKCCLAEQWGLIIPALQESNDILFPQDTSLSHAQQLVSQTKRILAQLQGKSEFERQAFLESCVAITLPNGTTKLAVARAEGVIIEQERGKGSFEFDTIFVKHDYMKTLAELSPSVRSRISHRRKALEKLIGVLETLR